MYFKASLDLASKIITWSLTGFILVYSFLLKDINPLILLPILIILPILIFTYLYQPLGYEITIDYIEIHRRVNKFYIPRNEIESVMVLHHNELGRTWRTMGNGGLFGYTGYYNSSKFGNMRWFLSRRDNAVLIRMKNEKKYLISPDDAKGFVEAQQQDYFG